LVVARAKLFTGGLITLEETDVYGPVMNAACYDIFTETLKPQMHIVGDQELLVVVIPGRCQTLVRFELLPDENSVWRNAKADVTNNGEFGLDYITSSAFDPISGNFFYISKKYNSPGSTIWLVDVRANPWSRGYGLPLPNGEAIAYLNMGAEGAKTVVDVITPAAGLVQRMEMVGHNLSITGWARVPLPILGKMGSFVYISPYLYGVSNEPAGKVARIHRDYFGPIDCGVMAFWNKTKCGCETGYSPMKDKAGCELSVITEEITKERKVVGTAALMGVLFVLTTIIAFVGWRAWYQNKQLGAGAPLVREYNRPL